MVKGRKRVRATKKKKEEAENKTKLKNNNLNLRVKWNRGKNRCVKKDSNFGLCRVNNEYTKSSCGKKRLVKKAYY